MLNMTTLELELISDADMYFSFEGLRSGISKISNRCSKASNKYLKFNKISINLKSTIIKTYYILMRCLNFFQHTN